MHAQPACCTLCMLHCTLHCLCHSPVQDTHGERLWLTAQPAPVAEGGVEAQRLQVTGTQNNSSDGSDTHHCHTTTSGNC